MTQILEQYQQITQIVPAVIGTIARGWWADTSLGADFTGVVGKNSPDTPQRFNRAVEDALAFLVSDGRAKSIVCTSERSPSDKSRLNYEVVVTRPDNISERIRGVWSI